VKEWQVARILIAEDDPRIGAVLEKGLRANGYSTFLADNGVDALSLGLTDEFDLLILDMGLPEREGFHVLQDLRARGRTLPVLVLTGRTERDVAMCLEAGADDFMGKPFDFDELLARVRARLIKRVREPEPNILKAGKVTLDLRSRRAAVGEKSVALTAREFRMLETLLRHPGQILSRRQLLSDGWGESFDGSSNVVDVCIYSLRQKLGSDVIETVREAGYRLSA
jgi:two-component system, OmpR family, copper resistance phosphate regulon response regulator CusR